MTLSKSGIRQLLREYFEDYNAESRFIYAFGGEQFLIKESINRSEGVSKHIIIKLFDEYMEPYNIKECFIYDMQNCHFLIGLQTASFKELSNSQKHITKPDNYCIFKNCVCEHMDTSNNKEIGYTVCSGEYCEGVKNSESKSSHVFDKGFGENELLS